MLESDIKPHKISSKNVRVQRDGWKEGRAHYVSIEITPSQFTTQATRSDVCPSNGVVKNGAVVVLDFPGDGEEDEREEDLLGKKTCEF